MTASKPPKTLSAKLQDARSCEKTTHISIHSQGKYETKSTAPFTNVSRKIKFLSIYCMTLLAKNYKSRI